CNLRCRYCYEWDELERTDRLPLEAWRQLLLSIRDYHSRRVREVGSEFRSLIIWHGGEPLLLPRSYFKDVLALQHEILGEGLARGDFGNAVQTNLYHVRDDILDLMARERFQIGVSIDLVPGLRLSVAGGETEDRVVANIDHLRERGLHFGAIVVLAGHTHRRLPAIYNFFEALGVDLRVIPIFDAPLNTPEASFSLSSEEAVAALCRLFRHWIRRPNRIGVLPLRDYAYAAFLKLTGRTQWQYDRRDGEWAIVVNTDGAVYQVLDAYDRSLALGNIQHQSFDA